MSEKPEMEVLNATATFDRQDSRVFLHTKVVYRIGEATYIGKMKRKFREVMRENKQDIKLEEIYDRLLIPDAHVHPLFPPHLTRASDPLPQDCFIKGPLLRAYDPQNPTWCSDYLLEEATILEKILPHPHPNIVKYYGCQVKDGRITGLCFAKYHETLLMRVNPGFRGKRLFDATERPLTDMKLFVESVQKGLEHLHSLGLVYNAVNQHTIMFPAPGDDTAILVDFHHCRPIGHSLEDVARSPEWSDMKVLSSLPTNDTDALQEIIEFLSNGKNYKFEVWC